MEVIKNDAKYQKPDELYAAMKKGIKIILSGWQVTNFPVSYSEQDNVKKEYMILIHGKENHPRTKDGKPRRAHTGDFIGPSSVSLEHKNIMNIVEFSIHNTPGGHLFAILLYNYVIFYSKIYLLSSLLPPNPPNNDEIDPIALFI